MSTRKRRFEELEDIEGTESILTINETPIKKQKLNNVPLLIVSALFPDDRDQQQFLQIFQSIDQSQLIYHLNIPQIINKQIAEYSTGKLEPCSNKKCTNKISVLYQDEEIYAEFQWGGEQIYAHKTGDKLGYMVNENEDEFFCNECMKLVTQYPCHGDCGCYCCDGSQLYFEADYQKCAECEQIVGFCGNSNCCGFPWYCNECDSCFCGDCTDNNYVKKICAECQQVSCGCNNAAGDSVYSIHGKGDEGCIVCNDCFDETIIKCIKCDAKCKLVHKSNKWISSDDDDADCQMEKCDYKNCDIFICMNCNEKERNGKVVRCEYKDCYHHDTFCTQHIPKRPFKCTTHRK